MGKERKILHLSLDDKFTDMALYYFELLLPKSNTLIVYSDKKPKFVKSKSVLVNKYSVFKKINIDEYDLVVVHSLSYVWYKFILKMPKNIPIVWIGWGYDYYDLLHKKVYLRRTSDLILKLQKINILSYFKSIFINFFSPRKVNVIQRIDYFSPVLSTEYDLVKNTLALENFPKYISFNYGSLERNFIKGFEDIKTTGKNILVGNSATYTNNHIEAFDLIKKYNTNGLKVICPLSYGDNKYRDIIKDKGYQYFGESFEPLADFIPIDDYISKISSCGIIIMNHVRQQALGNIIIMLYMGGKVFLREENPIYSFLKKKGAIIFSIQDLEKDTSLLNINITDAEIDKNRSILISFISEKITLDKTSNIIALAKVEK